MPDSFETTPAFLQAAAQLSKSRTARLDPQRSGPVVAKLQAALRALEPCPYKRLRRLQRPGPAEWDARDAALKPDLPHQWLHAWRAALAGAAAEAAEAAERDAAARAIPLLLEALPLLAAGAPGAKKSRAKRADKEAQAQKEVARNAYAAVRCIGKWGTLIEARLVAERKGAAEAAAAAAALAEHT